MTEDSRVFKHVDSRAYGHPVDSRADSPHYGTQHIAGAGAGTGLKGEKGDPGPKHSDEEIKTLIREVLAEGNYKGEPGVSNTPGPVGPRGPAGESVVGPKGVPGQKGDSPSAAELKSLIVEVLKTGDFRGERGPVGPQGERGFSVKGDRGEQGPVGYGKPGPVGPQGPAGKDGNNPLTVEQIEELVGEVITKVLANKVSHEFALVTLAKIQAELHIIDGLGNGRPSLRPIYADMTGRIRNIIG